MPEISAMVEGGKATAGAPLGPALGPLGVNIGEVIKQINDKTKSFNGMKVPVKVIVDSKTKSFEISVGSPPTSALIKGELKAQKGSGKPNLEMIGNLSMEQVKKLSEMKAEGLASTDLKKSAREIIGTCNSMGVTIEGLPAKEAQKKFAAGEYDSQFK
ncbi:MAG: 50S ribosomal protein L11 [Candidatus Diapherotrites archaeon]|nr:50S ribosomal protein L11 [Candidatus Diapherotrites archaeon]